MTSNSKKEKAKMINESCCEITPDELAQVAGGFAGLAGMFGSRIIAAQRELLLGDRCPCSNSS
jgi:hypothetical protein